MRNLISALIMGATPFAAMADDTAPAPRSIECVAVFEIMSRAAPTWTSQDQVIDAWQVWDRQAVSLAAIADVDYGTQLNREMTRLADLSATTPDVLSSEAMRCVADAPF